jgi:tol-pal system protein YbgF
LIDDRRTGLAVALLAAVVVAPAPVQAQAQILRPQVSAPVAGATVEARLERLERMLSEQSLSDLVLQLQQLQQEVQELRGQVELQQYTLQQMRGSRFGGAPRFGSTPAPIPGGPGLPPFPGSESGADMTQPGDATGAEDGDEALAAVPRPSLPPQQGLGAQGRGSGPSGGGLLGLPTPETTAGGEREAYRGAFDLLKDRDYAGAKQAFTDLLSTFPQGQFADNARYWLGEIGYVTKDYAAARAQFNRLITDYPLSPKVPGAMLKLGYVYDEEGDAQQARALLQDIVTRFPDTTESRLAQGRLQQMGGGGG